MAIFKLVLFCTVLNLMLLAHLSSAFCVQNKMCILDKVSCKCVFTTKLKLTTTKEKTKKTTKHFCVDNVKCVKGKKWDPKKCICV